MENTNLVGSEAAEIQEFVKSENSSGKVAGVVVAGVVVAGIVYASYKLYQAHMLRREAVIKATASDLKTATMNARLAEEYKAAAASHELKKAQAYREAEELKAAAAFAEAIRSATNR